MPVVIRPFELGDSEAFHLALSDAEDLHLLTTTFERPWTVCDVRSYVSRAQDEAIAKTAFRYGVFDAGDPSMPVGFAELHGLDWIHRRGSVGIALWQPAARGKGHGSLALQWLLNLGFRRLGLHRLQATVFETNKPSLKLFENSGFRREGILKEYAFVEGGFLDVVLLARLAVGSSNTTPAST